MELAPSFISNTTIEKEVIIAKKVTNADIQTIIPLFEIINIHTLFHSHAVY